MDGKFVKTLLEDVAEQAKAFRESFREQYGLPYGAGEPDDATFVAWFNAMMARDPNWIEALPYVDGGREELMRYRRIMVKGLRALAEEVGNGIL